LRNHAHVPAIPFADNEENTQVYAWIRNPSKANGLSS
jgi:hypothetical protein